MRTKIATKAIKYIVAKTAKKQGRATLKSQSPFKEMLQNIANDPEFRNYSVLLSTGSVVGGVIFTVMIRTPAPVPAEQIQEMVTEAVKTEFEKHKEEIDRKMDEGIDKVFQKITEQMKPKGLVPQEGDIDTAVVETDSNTATMETDSSKTEIENENKKLKKDLEAKNSTIQTQQFCLLGAVVLLAAFLFRPSKAMEMLEDILNEK